jgi:hypothetical protein
LFKFGSPFTVHRSPFTVHGSRFWTAAGRRSFCIPSSRSAQIAREIGRHPSCSGTKACEVSGGSQTFGRGNLRRLPPAHVAEGFGRFNPLDFARFTVIARSSIMESQSHLIDAVDKRYITERTRLELDSLAVSALEEVTGLMEHLQSPEALRNARRARERRIASRPERLAGRTRNREPPNPEQPNREPRTEPEHEQRRQKSEKIERRSHQILTGSA